MIEHILKHIMNNIIIGSMLASSCHWLSTNQELNYNSTCCVRKNILHEKHVVLPTFMVFGSTVLEFIKYIATSFLSTHR